MGEVFLGVIGLSTVSLSIVVACIALFAGFVKGAVGFALPMILISGLGSILAPDVALAALLIPILAANLIQSLSDGARAALQTLRRFWVYILCLLVVLSISAQFVPLLRAEVLYVLIGLPIVSYAVSQILGWRLTFAPDARGPEAAFGLIAGLMSGLAGTWGPPTVMYFTAIDLDKRTAIRAQGVIYLMGSVMLTFAHLNSGILRSETAPLSVFVMVIALFGLRLGTRLNKRLPQAAFRRMMLWVLLIAGANLIRRGVMGA
ncbi:MAG: sulfite exporter TauE/SafE family protein [Maritimibacter sp.]